MLQRLQILVALNLIKGNKNEILHFYINDFVYLSKDDKSNRLELVMGA